MKIHIILFLTIICSFSAKSQDCDCKANFKWLQDTFMQNDAGANYIVSKKGLSAYTAHTSIIEKNVESISDHDKCREQFVNWLQFFRSGHIEIYVLRDESAPSTAAAPISTVNLDQFKLYLSKKQEVDIEGIWKFGGYELAIKRTDERLLGSIISSTNENWKKDEVKLIINDTGEGTYYMGNKSKEKISKAELVTDNLLRIDDYYLTRTYLNKDENNEQIKAYLRVTDGDETYGYNYNENTFYLRIPSFNHTKKSVIDSIVNSNLKNITSRDNLIVDIRGNGGGSDISYEALLPLMYTNPIRSIGVEILSTELNNQKTRDIIEGKYGDLSEEDLKYYEEQYEVLSKNIGEFVSMNDSPVDIVSFDKIYPQPNQIGIIIDEKCGSTAEQFLLDAKQSSKVKLFGHTTAGALDISNLHMANSPSNEFVLFFGTSKSKRIPGMVIDDIGLQPDIYIDETIPIFDWVNFVSEYLNNK